MKRALLLDVVVGECATVLELLACENEALLVRWDAARVLSQHRATMSQQAKHDIPLLVLNLGLDVVNGVAGLDLEGDGLASKTV